jgi:hypothetical protein
MGRKLKHARLSYAEDRRVLELAAQSKSLEQIANLMNRTPKAIRKVAVRLGISFKAREKAKGDMMMRALVILAAVCFSTSAYAQDAPPKVGNKPLALVKPKEPMGCKLVGTVKGTKLWAGDCVGSELRGATPATETQSLPEAAAGAIPPGQKQ